MSGRHPVQRPMALELIAVGYRYPDPRGQGPLAVEGVDIALSPGRCLALVGATGSGKSTVAQVAAALLRPTGGQVLLDGLDVWPKASRQRAERHAWLHRHVGMVFQYPEGQFFEERVSEEIAYGPRNFGLPPGNIPDMVNEALEVVGLPRSIADRSPFQLSGGEMRRVALASILVSGPRYLVLEEPTAGLDGTHRSGLLQLLRQLVVSGIGLLLITHRMDEVVDLADEVAVLHRGKVVACASPRALFAAGVPLREWGLDLPPAAAVLQDLVRAGVDVPTGALTVEEAAGAILRRWSR